MSHSPNITFEQLRNLIYDRIKDLKDISETTKIEELTVDTNHFARTLNSEFQFTLTADDFRLLETVGDLLKMLNRN
ncbi:hypothetical protein [Pseudomonas urmiensis]|uniref:hypothetical protein n=1 Tax=Pseudomonas urmiensis TaxID=2745493 RepID=UPI0034D674E1